MGSPHWRNLGAHSIDVERPRPVFMDRWISRPGVDAAQLHTGHSPSDVFSTTSRPARHAIGYGHCRGFFAQSCVQLWIAFNTRYFFSSLATTTVTACQASGIPLLYTARFDSHEHSLCYRCRCRWWILGIHHGLSRLGCRRGTADSTNGMRSLAANVYRQWFCTLDLGNVHSKATVHLAGERR
jgi:hypothetical protein